jgi:hypothetical protein
MFARVVALVCVGLLGSSALAQRFNIDMDDPSAFPYQGGGVPSIGFGAAAGQPGFWNSINTPNPVNLLDLGGAATSVVMSVVSSDPVGTTAAFNPLTSGDYALLLNDARQVGLVFNGGFQTYTFTGLENGPYQVYTYAASPAGFVSATPVDVPGSSSPNPQVVTGPVAGDFFALGITHSLHDVLVTNGALVVNVTMPPGVENGGWIAGFQIVPEPHAFGLFLLGGLLMARVRRPVR